MQVIEEYMSRQVVRNTRKKQQSGLLGNLRNRMPLTRDQITELALPAYVSLDLLARKMGTDETFRLLSQYSVLIDILCRAGMRPDGLPRAAKCLEHLEISYGRAITTADWSLSDDALEAARDALALFMEQLEAATLPEVVAAHVKTLETLQAAKAKSQTYAIAA
jgi:hypothetical protein